MNDESKTAFKVTDKRRFTVEGDERAEQEQDNQEASSAKESPAQGAMPAIDFPTFILSLASSAQVHLGILNNPATGTSEKNLDLAKQTIDILGMLQEKTKGNLAKEEARLLEGVLYDLRMKYVELNAKPKEES